MTKPLTAEQVQELEKWLKAQEKYWEQKRAFWLDKGRTSIADQCSLAGEAFTLVLSKLASLEGENEVRKQ